MVRLYIILALLVLFMGTTTVKGHEPSSSECSLCRATDDGGRELECCSDDACFYGSTLTTYESSGDTCRSTLSGLAIFLIVAVSVVGGSVALFLAYLCCFTRRGWLSCFVRGGCCSSSRPDTPLFTKNVGPVLITLVLLGVTLLILLGGFSKTWVVDNVDSDDRDDDGRAFSLTSQDVVFIGLFSAQINAEISSLDDASKGYPEYSGAWDRLKAACGLCAFLFFAQLLVLLVLLGLYGLHLVTRARLVFPRVVKVAAITLASLLLLSPIVFTLIFLVSDTQITPTATLQPSVSFVNAVLSGPLFLFFYLLVKLNTVSPNYQPLPTSDPSYNSQYEYEYQYTDT